MAYDIGDGGDIEVPDADYAERESRRGDQEDR